MWNPFWLMAVMFAAFAWVAVRRVRRHERLGWLLLGWSLGGIVILVGYRPLFKALRPSLANWPALLVIALVNLVWIGPGIWFAVAEWRASHGGGR